MADVVRLCTFSVPTALVVARAEGFFERAGLDVRIERATGSARQFEDLAAGRHDVLHTNADNVMKPRGADGADAVVLTVVELGLTMNPVVAPGREGWQDLVGGVVAVDAADSGYAFVLYDLLRRHGIEPDAYQVVEVGAPARRAEALLEGRADVALVGHRALWSAVDGGARVLARGTELFPDYPGLTVAARRDTLEDDGDRLLDYAAALRAAAVWAADPANHDAVVADVARAQEVDDATAETLVAQEDERRCGVAPDASAIAASVGSIAELRHRWTHEPPPQVLVPAVLDEIERRTAAQVPGSTP